jgi:hypothetical protein
MKTVGRKWLKLFLRRHPHVSIRIPEGLLISRAGRFAPESLSFFLSTSPQWTHNIQHNPTRLYNGDETGITIVQHKHTKILELKGERQISFLKSLERVFLVTLFAFTSPTGHFISPILVLRKKYETKTDE